MTHWTEATDLIGDRETGARGVIVRYAPGALAFALSAALGAYLVYLRPMLRTAAPPAAVAPAPDLTAFGGLAPLTPPPAITEAAKPAGNPFGALVTQGFGSSGRFEIAESPVPLPPQPPAELRGPSPTEDIAPLPPRRPSALARTAEPSAPPAGGARPAPEPEVARVEPKSAEQPGLFEKLFGGSGSQSPAKPATTLAYAAPPPTSGVGSALAGRGGLNNGNSGGFGGFLRGLNMGSSPASRFGDHVAVYDISARVVYLPDGTQLEAHSGLGSLRDDPSSVATRMRGATPPATYALTPREELFHGVPALRLTPIDSSVYGRAGLLAHTYMLGPDGDSNGCVSFRDYDAFLRAFRSGQINKLVVVTRL
jgi:hypothetical protein